MSLKVSDPVNWKQEAPSFLFFKYILTSISSHHTHIQSCAKFTEQWKQHVFLSPAVPLCEVRLSRMSMKDPVFWDVKPHTLVNSCQGFSVALENTCRGQELLFCPGKCAFTHNWVWSQLHILKFNYTLAVLYVNNGCPWRWPGGGWNM
jgi:hypothetical protein